MMANLFSTACPNCNACACAPEHRKPEDQLAGTHMPVFACFLICFQAVFGTPAPMKIIWPCAPETRRASGDGVHTHREGSTSSTRAVGSPSQTYINANKRL